MKRALYIIRIIAGLTLAFLGGWLYGLQDGSNTNPISSTDTEQAEDSEPVGSDEKQNTSYTSAKGVNIEVLRPYTNATVASPLTVSGSVPGSWSFEASFPVVLLDANRKVVTQEPATISGDWMTDEPVPFTVTLNFANFPTKTGYLLLQKDNPSGLPENDDSLEIPLKFSQ